MEFQEILVIVIVATAIVAVVRTGMRVLRGEKTGCSCGGCGKSRIQKWMRAQQSGQR